MAELGAGSGTGYPAAIDTDTSQESTSTVARSNVPNDLAAAVIAVETELGTDPAGTLTDVKTFLQTNHATNGTHSFTDFTNANHSHVSAATGGIIPSIRDKSRGLIVKNGTDANNDIDVDADEIILQDSSGGAVRASSVNLTIVCDATQTVSEANKRDYADDGGSGYKTASAWHYVWVIYNGTTVAGLASKNSTLATISLPTGYTYGALVGAIYTDASRNFVVTYQRGNRVRCNPGSYALTADTVTLLDISAQVPATAKFYHGSAYRTDADGSLRLLQIHPLTFTEGVGNAFCNLGFGINNPTLPVACPIETAQTIYYTVTTASITYTLYTTGWEY